MTSLVSDFIINPVIRQARRFSTGFATDPEPDSPSRRGAPDAQTSPEDAISETEEAGGPVAGAVELPQASTVVASGPSRLRKDSSRRDNLDGPAQSGVSAMTMRNNSTEPDGTPRIWRSNSTPPGNTFENGVGAPLSVDEPPRPIPADDQKKVLREEILAIQSSDISSADKASLMHQLLRGGYTTSGSRLTPRTLSQGSAAGAAAVSGALESLKFWTAARESSSTPEFVLTADDLRPTYATPPPSEDVAGVSTPADDELLENPQLGCEHYRRNVKLQCAECERWYTCRFCHDAVESHMLPRRSTKHMLCMLCGCAQKASDTCVKCGESASRYYCNICKLWNDDPNKSIYHCNDCGICRIGKGLGKDFYHCKTCTACIAIETEKTHRCIERSTDCDCPICLDYMFTSPKTVIFMKCGHSIHDKCWQEYLKTSYKCPICNKSTVNMETQFRNLDIAIASQPMPLEFRSCRAVVLCNDCCAKSSTAYHWLGLKCAICNSYNTVQLRLLAEEEPSAIVPAIPNLPNEEWVESSLGGGAPEALAALGALTPRDIPLPRAPSIHRAGTSIGSRDGGASAFSPFLVPDRLARSVSPITAVDFSRAALGHGDPAEDADNDSDEEDMIDFWGREESRNITSAESADGTGSHAGSDDDEDDEADCEDDEDDDDEEEISLFGHR